MPESLPVAPLKLLEKSQDMALVQSSPSLPSIPPRDIPDKRYSGRDVDRLGPGDYDQDVQSLLRYDPRSTDFHTSSSERQLHPPICAYENTQPHPEFPAPNAYNITGELKKGVTSAFVEGMDRPCLKKDPDHWAPGPGAYELPCMTEDGPKEDDDQLAEASMRSATDRKGWYRPAITQPFSDSSHFAVPGPGYYPKPSSTFKGGASRRVRSTKDVTHRKTFHAVHQPQQLIALRESDAHRITAFSSTELKSCQKADKETGPAPCHYSNDDQLGRSMANNLKQKAPVGRKGVFGSIADRFYGFCITHESTHEHDGSKYGGSDPGAYHLKQTYAGGTCHSCFKPGEKSSMYKSASSPDFYDAKEPNYRSKFRRAKTEHLSFGSSANRWSENEVFVGQPFRPLPGPGEYDPRLGVQLKVRGAARSSQDRGMTRTKPSQGTGCVGPGQYDVRGSMMVKTFNVSEFHGNAILENSTPWVGGSGGGVVGTKARLGR